jgi:hypothetical protein
MDVIMNIRTAIIVACLLSTSVVNAEIVETDWKDNGDSLVTLDTETGIEWLDLTQTDGMSINQAENLLSSTFSGWRLPTRTEVTEMMVNAFPNQAAFVQGGGSFAGTTFDDEADSFRGLFGHTHADSTFDYTFGLYKNDDGQTNSVILSGVQDRRGNNNVSLYSNHNMANTYSYSSIVFGVYLVSDGGTTLSSQLNPSMNSNNANYVAVSAPALLGLISLGLFGFAARRRSSTLS